MSKRRGTWPTETCPVCGTKWERYCRRREWGYYYNASESQIESYLTLLCSAECSKRYAEMRMAKRAEKTLRTRSAQVLRLIEKEGATRAEALAAVGIKDWGNVERYADEMWKELDWLRAHDWEVGA